MIIAVKDIIFDFGKGLCSIKIVDMGHRFSISLILGHFLFIKNYNNKASLASDCLRSPVLKTILTF